MTGRIADRAVQIHGGAGYMGIRHRALLPRWSAVSDLRRIEPDPAAHHRPRHDEGGAGVKGGPAPPPRALILRQAQDEALILSLSKYEGRAGSNELFPLRRRP